MVECIVLGSYSIEVFKPSSCQEHHMAAEAEMFANWLIS